MVLSRIGEDPVAPLLAIDAAPSNRLGAKSPRVGSTIPDPLTAPKARLSRLRAALPRMATDRLVGLAAPGGAQLHGLALGRLEAREAGLAASFAVAVENPSGRES